MHDASARSAHYAATDRFTPVADVPDRPSDVVFVITATAESAERVALLTAKGAIPRLYHFGCDCLSDWRNQPSYSASIYLPWRVDLWLAPRGVLRLASKRLDRQG